MPRETDPLLGNHHRNSSYDHEPATPSWRARLAEGLSEEIDVAACGPALACQCMIAGAADVAAYSQSSTWAAFMTGNITQLIMAATTVSMTYPAPEASVLRLLNSSSSVFGFIVGSFAAMLVDRNFGPRHRGKLVGWALWRGLVFAALVPCIARYGWGGQSGMAILFVMASNMGSMAVNASKLGSTPYATTVVFTSTLASLFSDPLLPLGLSSASRTRAISILALMAGGAAGQVLMLGVTRVIGDDTSSFQRLAVTAQEAMPLGSAATTSLVAIIEFVAALCWYKARRAEV